MEENPAALLQTRHIFAAGMFSQLIPMGTHSE